MGGLAQLHNCLAMAERQDGAEQVRRDSCAVRAAASTHHLLNAVLHPFVCRVLAVGLAAVATKQPAAGWMQMQAGSGTP